MSWNPVDGKRKRRMVATRRIEHVRDHVLSFFREHPLFHGISLEHTSESHENGLGGYTITIRLQGDRLEEEDLFANVILSFRYQSVPLPVPESKKYEEIETLTAEIPSVHSNIGQSAGFFLLHLAMVISILSGVSVITLDNDTNNPERSIKGIYQLFEPNMRTESAYAKKRFKQFPHELNVKAERIRFVDPNDLHVIETVLLQKVKQEIAKNTPRSIWRGYAEDTLRMFFRSKVTKMEEYQFLGGGRGRGGRGGRGRGRGRGTRIRRRRQTHMRRTIRRTLSQ